MFYPGVVHSAEEDGLLNIHCDDGEKKVLDMSSGVWNFNYAVAANYSSMPTNSKVTSTENSVLSSMLKRFGKKTFLRKNAKGFDQLLLV